MGIIDLPGATAMHRHTKLCMFLVGSIISLFGSHISAQETAKEGATVFGIALGKPLTLPGCTKKPDLFEIESTVTCYYPPTNKPTDTSYQIILQNPPPTVRSITAVIHNGLLDTLYVWTFGISTQDVTLSSLKDRFGEPSIFEETPYQNAYGARFVGYHAIWRTSSLYVDYDAAFSRKSPEPRDQGRISIQTLAAYNDEIKKLQQKIQSQGKF